MLTSILLFFLKNPIGKKIGLGLLIALSLLLAYKHVYNTGKNEGIQIGISQGLKEAEDQNRPIWEARQNAINSDRKALDKRSTELKEQEAALKKRSTTLRAAVAIHGQEAVIEKAYSDAIVASLTPSQAVTQAQTLLPEITTIPNAPAENQILAIMKEVEEDRFQIALLNKDLSAALELIEGFEDAKAAAALFANDREAAHALQVNVLSEQLDFYKHAYKTATKKRGCGLFKKVFTLWQCGR